MSAPVVTLITPANNQTDVVLGTPITVTFDQAINPASVNTSTFSLFGPGVNSIIGSAQLERGAVPGAGREFVTGIFTWPAPNQVVFTTSRSLRPSVKYTLILAGLGLGTSAGAAIKNPAGESMAQSVQITFMTGTIDQAAVPPSSPVPWNDPSTQPWMRPALDPATISVIPVNTEGNDLTQQITLTFSAPLDTTSFSPSDINVAVEAITNDPLISVPPNLQYTVTVSGNVMTILVGNWPPDSPPPLIMPPPPSLYFETPSADMALINPGVGARGDF